MKRLRSWLLVSVTVSSLLFFTESFPAQSRKITALVGGTLIDAEMVESKTMHRETVETVLVILAAIDHRAKARCE